MAIQHVETPVKRIIGGMFGLEQELSLPNKRPPFLKEGDICLVNGRSGITILVELVSAPHIWMPSYLCSSMLKAVERYSSSVRFYEVGYDLTITSRDWLEDVHQGDLVVLIDYFGFDCDESCAIQAKEKGAFVLEDACQALLSRNNGQHADFVLYSPRKFLGVPDGGILSPVGKMDVQIFELKAPRPEWWLNTLYATVERRDFDIYGGSRHWFETYQTLKATAPIGRYAMSELTRCLLEHGFDYETIARQRIDNYRALAERLGSLAIFPMLSSCTVPLGFPIRVSDRDKVRQTLFDHEIYPPVHWPIKNVVPEKFAESHRLAADILTLPCDQRYDTDDMERMAQVVQKG